MPCRLCYAEAEILLPVYDDDGTDTKGIAAAIEKFLEIELNANSTQRSNICISCWASVDNFQKFFNMVAEKQLEQVEQKIDDDDDDGEAEGEGEDDDVTKVEIEEDDEQEYKLDFVDMDVDYAGPSVNNLIFCEVEAEHVADAKKNPRKPVESITTPTSKTTASASTKTPAAAASSSSTGVTSTLPKMARSRGRSAFFSWNIAAIVKLIREYEVRPELWAIRPNDSYNRRIKQKSMQEVANALGCPPAEAKRKFQILKSTFAQELSKENSAANDSATANDSAYTSKWRYYDNMLFLKPIIRFAKTNANNEKADSNEISFELLITEEDIKDSFKWDREKVIHLINEYKKHPDLWDITAEGYHDKFARGRSLQEIANVIGCTAAMAYKKFKTLRIQFHREIASLIKKAKESYTGETCRSKWEFFHNLMFLKRTPLVAYTTTETENVPTGSSSSSGYMQNSNADANALQINRYYCEKPAVVQLPIQNLFKWTHADVHKLIVEFEKRSELWDIKSKDFRNRDLREKSLQEVADIIGCTAETAYTRFRNLRSNFVKHLAKLNENPDYVSQWVFFKSLMFLTTSPSTDAATANVHSFRDDDSEDITFSIIVE